MGGEPLCKENLILTEMVIAAVRDSLPQTEIYVWTGYTFSELEKQKNDNSHIQYILCVRPADGARSDQSGNSPPQARLCRARAVS